MSRQSMADLFARAHEIEAEARSEIAKSHELRKQAAELLDRLHDGITDLHTMESRSHTTLAAHPRPIR